MKKNQKDKLKAIFYKKYFEIAMENNILLVNKTKKISESLYKNLIETKENYKNFFQLINKLIYLRKTQILNKQVDIFTTNIDILNEFILDEMGYDFMMDLLVDLIRNMT